MAPRDLGRYRRGTGARAIMTRGPAGKNAWLALLLAAALAACTGSGGKKEEPNILPAGYKPKIIALLRDRLPDPTGIRDAYITEPALKQTGNVSRYVVCVRYNAKGYDKKYAGSTDKVAYFYGGEITQMVDAPGELCGKADYQPWPELQKLCVEAVCP